MKVPSRTASRAHHIICPLCERGALDLLGTGASPAAAVAGCRCSAPRWRPCVR
jgi:hypothetical protein